MTRELSYVLPLRWERDQGIAELAAYLDALPELVAEVLVVDGSPPARFAANAASLPERARHIRPEPLGSLMGKVDGVLTGLRIASADAVIVADDDVRWDEPELRRASQLLDSAAVVRPQNYFDPLPWHARIDTARSLINRACSFDLDLGPGDFPGTLAVRRSWLERTAGYDGDVMFENLELMRTVAAAGGEVVTPLDLYVRRLPPTSRHYLSQRVRQAYDDFALPLRMAVWLMLLPLVALAPRRAGAAVAALSTGVAEAGRRRAGGARVFAASSAALAPVWVAERALCSWLAVWQRVRRGGIEYAGRRLPRSATPMRELRRRYGYAARAPVSSASLERTTGSGRSASPSAAPSA